MWTGGIYGCHNDHKTSLCSNIGPFINHVINISAVVAFYSLILFKMMLTSRHEDIKLKNISFTVFTLTGAYIAFLTPLLARETCSPWATTTDFELRYPLNRIRFNRPPTAAATDKGVRAIIAGCGKIFQLHIYNRLTHRVVTEDWSNTMKQFV